MSLDLPTAHARAVENTQRVIDGISPDQLHRPTPCADWDVAGLLQHVIAGNWWVAPLVEGQTIEEVGDRYDGDLVGDDPSASYRSSGEAAVAAFNAPGAMDAPCAVSYGPVPGSIYCGHRFIDVLVHGWDLAVGTGGDTELPDELVETCIAVVLPQLEMLAGSAMFGGAHDPGADVAPQTRLLTLLGRDG